MAFQVPSKSDCAYEFEQGKEYLVYAYHPNQELCKRERALFTAPDRDLEETCAPENYTTSVCSRTQEASSANEDLKFLKSEYNSKGPTTKDESK